MNEFDAIFDARTQRLPGTAKPLPTRHVSNVLPTGSVHHCLDCFEADPVTDTLLSKKDSRFEICRYPFASDSANGLLAQFSSRITITCGGGCGPVPDLVHVIGLGSSPFQVCQSAIPCLSIEMTAFHSCRFRTMESCENQLVDVASFFGQVGSIQNDYLISTFGIGSWLENPASARSGFTSPFDYNASQRFDSAQIGNPVVSDIARNVPPEFFAPVGMVLNSLIEKFTFEIATGHNHLPQWYPQKINRQAAGIAAFRVIGPSLWHSNGFVAKKAAA